MLPILDTSLAYNAKEIRMDMKGSALIEFTSEKSMHLDEEL